MDKFELVSEFEPRGDQPQAIDTLVEGVKRGEKFQTLLGVTEDLYNGECYSKGE